jgi:hypothetical protein
MPKVENSRS